MQVGRWNPRYLHDFFWNYSILGGAGLNHYQHSNSNYYFEGIEGFQLF